MTSQDNREDSIPMTIRVFICTVMSSILTGLAAIAGTISEQETQGYFRFPAIHGDQIIFTAEGDLWKAPISGGTAQRLTTHTGVESEPAISPDGRLIAFSAQYEGPTEVYTMPIEGGLPTRRTFDGGSAARVIDWTPDQKILFTTSRYSYFPDAQLAVIDLANGKSSLIPISQASDGIYDDNGKSLFFVRMPFQGSYTKRYQGGMTQNIWRFDGSGKEASALTADFTGTSKSPMFWQGRLYFVSDRDGVMNIWSMNPQGVDLKQHTHHQDWDVKSPTLQNGRIVYQLGADLYLHDIESGEDKQIPITLASDFDQTRERWIKKPFDYVTAAHISPDGDRVLLTARGQLFVAPAEQGRFVEATRTSTVRYRNGRFLPDGKAVLALSDKTGELEFWTIPANGVGEPSQLTERGEIFRFDGIPSPDGKFIAYTDKDAILWIYDLTRKIHIKAYRSPEGTPIDLRWSPDSKWLAFVATADNWFHPIKLYRISDGMTLPVTTDRYDSYSPAWSPDGKWLYFLSDRHLQSSVEGVWEPRQADPFFDRQTKLYMIPLVRGERSPFETSNELQTKADEGDKTKKDDTEKKKDEDKSDAKDSPAVTIDTAGIQHRLIEIPAPPGNYMSLSATGEHLFWISQGSFPDRAKAVVSLKIDNNKSDIDTIANGVTDYELSFDRKKMMVRKENAIYVIAADGSSPSDLEKKKVKLDDWSFALNPRQEWRQMFIEAWRLERDYFYDGAMHGVDWPKVLNKYLPLVDRVTDRDELSDLLGEMVGELAALHVYIIGGDVRRGDDLINPASLGADLMRDDNAGGYRVKHIYRSDPDEPQYLSPLAKPDVAINEGDLITAINGQPTVSVEGIGLLLRRQAGKQVLVEVKPEGGTTTRTVIVTPITDSQARNLRYNDWEYSRRLRVDEMGDGRIGYVHLRAMNGSDFAQWARDFYPVHKREGLIIDVRHNNGGNIDSWILGKLLRKPWAYWQDQTGSPSPNMQYAFDGHMVVLCDQETYSDGELFAEGFKRLGLGKVIGMRTWGGEIWLSFRTYLADKGIATAPESGVFAPDGVWLIEGHGVDPDIVVDNLPHDSFNGKDAQLEAAIEYLKEQIQNHPIKRPIQPPYPDKSFRPRNR